MRGRWLFILLCAILVQLSGSEDGVDENGIRLTTISPDWTTGDDLFGGENGNGSEFTSGEEKIRRARDAVAKEDLNKGKNESKKGEKAKTSAKEEEERKAARVSAMGTALGIAVAILVLLVVVLVVIVLVQRKKERAAMATAKERKPKIQYIPDPVSGLTILRKEGEEDRWVVMGADINIRGPLIHRRVHNNEVPLKHALDGQEGGDKIEKIFFAKELNEGFYIGEGVEIVEPDSVDVSEGKKTKDDDLPINFGDEEESQKYKKEQDSKKAASASAKDKKPGDAKTGDKKSSKSKRAQAPIPNNPSAGDKDKKPGDAKTGDKKAASSKSKRAQAPTAKNPK